MNPPLGIGLVGAGRFGAFCVAAFEGLPEARVVAVMDTVRTRAEAITPPGAATCAYLEELLDDSAVDIVHVGTPPYLHGPITQQAAERGKHVFVEKPLATTLEAARAARGRPSRKLMGSSSRGRQLCGLAPIERLAVAATAPTATAINHAGSSQSG